MKQSWTRRYGRTGRLVLVLAFVITGCSSSLNADGSLVSGTVVDRYTIGNPANCPNNSDPACDESLRIATDVATGERGVPPASIAGHRFYYEFLPPGMARGGPPVVIVVFDLADGSRVAVGVYCGVGPCLVVNR